MNKQTPKIFGIGLSKTGTTSLARALDLLGYRTRDYIGVTRYRKGDLSSVDLEEIDANDAFTDTPIPSFYRELDAAYPGSRFILTIRDEVSWLKSCERQFTQKLVDKQNEAGNQVFLDLYGTAIFEKEKFKEGYDRFVTGVMDHFKDRPDDLLVMNITAGDGWEKLCAFLGKEIPDLPFPKANVTDIRWMNIQQLVTLAQEAGDRIRSALQARRAAEQGNLSLLGKAGYLFQGGTDGIRTKAVKESRKIILNGLRRLNPDIPIVTSGEKVISYEQRSNWNHFWLVDLVEEDDLISGPKEPITFSVALIEDRQPIMAAICAPQTSGVCYANARKPAYRMVEGKSPEELTLETDSTVYGSLASCIAKGTLPPEDTLYRNTREWETAAVQVILESCGWKLRVEEDGATLTYNKKEMLNSPFVLKNG